MLKKLLLRSLNAASACFVLMAPTPPARAEVPGRPQPTPLAALDDLTGEIAG